MSKLDGWYLVTSPTDSVWQYVEGLTAFEASMSVVTLLNCTFSDLAYFKVEKDRLIR